MTAVYDCHARTQYTVDTHPSRGSFVLGDTGTGQRLREFREALYGEDSQGVMADALTRLVGGKPIAYSLISAWERGQEGRYSLAAISLLHPTEPLTTLRWLQGKGKRPTIPRLHVDGVAVASTPQERVKATLRDVKREAEHLADGARETAVE